LRAWAGASERIRTLVAEGDDLKLQRHPHSKNRQVEASNADNTAVWGN
jgi:hypothetical protein